MTDEPKTHERLRVLLLADTLRQPGVGVYTVELTDRLCAEGHQVLLAVQGTEVTGRLAQSAAVVKSWRRAPFAAARWLVHSRYEPPVGDFQPQVIHATSPRVGSAARGLGRRLKAPVAVTVHGTSAVEDGTVRRALRNSTVIALSEAVREDLVNHLRVPKERIRLIYPGVQLPEGLPGPAPLGRTLVVGTIGALDCIGGHRFLLEALRKLLDRGMDLQLLIAGEGPQKGALRDLAARLLLHDAVTFAETAADPRELLEVMDVFVLPHTREGMSPLVLEAMALGKPVAVSGAGGTFAAVQHNHTGIVFRKGEVDAIADAILRLAIKPDFAARLVGHARELIAERFSVDRMIHETVSAYERMIGKRKAAAE